MRELANIRRIGYLSPIPNADKIEVASVDGWRVVVKKGEFNVGDLVVYMEVDSWVPHTIAPFLTKEGSEPKIYNGVPGQRLRTIKLRGQLSQGLVLPIEVAYEYEPADYDWSFVEGDDVTELLGIQKWEKPVPAELAGLMKGSFPSFIPKTDQERVQNIVGEIAAAEQAGLDFEVTEKLEGSSLTTYLYGDEFGVCSRNIDLKETEGNAYWEVVRRYNIEEKLRTLGTDYAIQGELIGPGIQDNIYRLSKTDFYVYDVYDIKAGAYLAPELRQELIKEIGLKHVPVLGVRKLASVSELLVMANGKSVLYDTLREGEVYKEMNGGMTFKAISDEYLLLHGD